MTQDQFDEMKSVMEFDLSMYLPAMINLRIYNDKQIFEMGAYVGVSYVHFSSLQNIYINDNDKLNILDFLFSFYSRNLRIGIDDSQKEIIKLKFDELLKTDNNIIQDYLENIINLTLRK